MNIQIPNDLADSLQARAVSCGFKDAEEFAIFLIQAEVDSQVPVQLTPAAEEQLDKLVQEGIDSGFEPFQDVDFQQRRERLNRRIADANDNTN